MVASPSYPSPDASGDAACLVSLFDQWQALYDDTLELYRDHDASAGDALYETRVHLEQQANINEDEMRKIVRRICDDTRFVGMQAAALVKLQLADLNVHESMEIQGSASWALVMSALNDMKVRAELVAGA